MSRQSREWFQHHNIYFIRLYGRNNAKKLRFTSEWRFELDYKNYTSTSHIQLHLPYTLVTVQSKVHIIFGRSLLGPSREHKTRVTFKYGLEFISQFVPTMAHKTTERTVRSEINVYIYIYCTILGVLDQFWTPIVRVTPLKTPFGLVIGLFTILARSYNYSQLSITLCCLYTAYKHLYVVSTITYNTITSLQ
jgi:hypothetical protein